MQLENVTPEAVPPEAGALTPDNLEVTFPFDDGLVGLDFLDALDLLDELDPPA